MEKTIEIDGKQVRFKSTGATALRYKTQFRKDYLSEIMKLFVLDKLDFNDLSPEDLDYIDFEVFYNIAWALAKTADRNIPDPITWLDGFDTFPIFEIIPEIQDMITSSIDAKKK